MGISKQHIYTLKAKNYFMKVRIFYLQNENTTVIQQGTQIFLLTKMKITENSQSQFINYVLDFYGQGGIYPLADPIINNKFVERDDVLKAFKKYKTLLDASILLEKELKIENRYTWGDGDSLDRERVRDILLQNYNFQWTK